ncbi:MAG: hypothetical protein HY996_02685 [Micrococcales bacterium]|nr:hypothetical protein [Micrococcales bacterium]
MLFTQGSTDVGGDFRDPSVLVELTQLSSSDLRLALANRIAALVAASAALVMGVTAVAVPSSNGPAEFFLLVLLVAGAVHVPIRAGALWRVVHETHDRAWRERLQAAALLRGPSVPRERSVAEVRLHAHA